MGYVDTVKSDGAASLYLMNQASGQFLDSIGTRHLTQSGTITRRQSVFPMQGAGILPDPASGVAEGPLAITSIDNISIEGWINLTSASHYGAWASQAETSSASGISIGMANGSPGLSSGVAGNKITVLHDGLSWNPTNFVVGVGLHHIVMTRTTGGSDLVYVDGAYAVTASGAVPSLNAGAATTKVGGYIVPSGPDYRIANYAFGGVAFYNLVLTPAQIANHYREGLRASVVGGYS